MKGRILQIILSYIIITALVLSACQNTTQGPGTSTLPKSTLDREYAPKSTSGRVISSDLLAASRNIQSLISQKKIVDSAMLDELDKVDEIIMLAMRLQQSESGKDKDAIAEILNMLQTFEQELQTTRAQKQDEMLEAKIKAQLAKDLSWLNQVISMYNKLYTKDQSTGDIYEYSENTASWIKVGGLGNIFAVDAVGRLYRISVGGKSIDRYDNQPMKWTQIGNAAANIYTGGKRLFSTNPQTSDIYEYYESESSWTRIGGPGDMFAINDYDQLYGLSIGSKGVYRYDNQPMKWTQIGNAAAKIYAGGKRLFATNPQSGDILEYDEGNSSWTKVGGPGDTFAVDMTGHLYGLSVGGKAIFLYDNQPMKWTLIGGPATKIYAHGLRLYSIEQEKATINMYDSITGAKTNIGGAGRVFISGN